MKDNETISNASDESNSGFKVKINCPKHSATTSSAGLQMSLGLCVKGTCSDRDTCTAVADAMAMNGISSEEAAEYREQALSKHGKQVEEGTGFQPTEDSGDDNNQGSVANPEMQPDHLEEKPKVKKDPALEFVVREHLGRQTVAITDVVIDDSLYPRVAAIEENIERLRGIGPDFKNPIIVSEDMILVDGFHRLEAMKLDGHQTVEVEIYRYKSRDTLLHHAVQLNCEHGCQLSNEEKKKWVIATFSSNTPVIWLARTVGVAKRTIQDWTSDLNKEAKELRNTTICARLDDGVSAEEVARELGVSESTVKRAGQKRKAAEMTHRTEQDDQPGDGKTAVPDSADHPDEDQQCDLPPDTISKEIPEKEGTDSNHEQRVNNHLNEGLSQLMMAQALYLLPSAPVVAIEELEEMLQRITDCIATFGSRK